MGTWASLGHGDPPFSSEGHSFSFPTPLAAFAESTRVAVPTSSST